MRTNRLLLLLGIGLLSASALAQAPQGFSYQAVARDAFGNAVGSQPIGVQFVLHQGNALGAVVYAETHSTATNANGLFALTVGGGSTGTGTFSSIDWSAGPYFLEVAMDVSSSGSYTPLGTQQLLSVPYALYAGKSNVPDGTEVGQILHWDGNAWVADSGLYVHAKRLGIGVQQPDAPLAIKSREVLKSYFQTGDVPTQDDFAFTSDSLGFGIEQGTPSSLTNRFFIQGSTGHIGLGTSNPDAALTIRSSNPLKAHFQNGNIPTQDDFWNTIDSYGLNTGQGNPDTGHVHLTLQSMTGHLGLGTNDPPAPLSIESREVLKTYFQTGDVPTQDQFGFTSDGTGFGIEQGAPDALTSRFFIQSSTGNVGIGTTSPQERFHMHAVHNGQSVGLRVSNGAVSTNGGWSLGHLNDELVAERNGAFSILEAPGSGGGAGGSRMVVLPGGNVGINEELPMTTLHVTRPVSDPAAAVSLNENSGIAVFGPITQNLALDYQGIQARIAMAGGTSTTGSAGSLHLQPHGGDIIIHGAFDPILEDQKITITTDGKMGVGKLPAEKLEINGAIVVGNTALAAPANGTIRWTGSDFEGRKGGQWRSLTTHTNTDGFVQGGSPGEIGYAPAGLDGQVGIGTTTPDAKLHVTGANDGGNVSILVENLEASADGGWLISAIDDNAVPERMKTFAIHEKTGVELTERMTMLPGGNLGINEPLPHATLHVTKPASDPLEPISLNENSGIVVVGPITDNLVMDHQGIQARIAMAGGTSTTGSAGSLHLQPLGGQLLIHGDSSIPETERVTISTEGKIGVGKAPLERLDVNGAITLGNSISTTPAEGTIRWNGTHFEGRTASDWVIFNGTVWGKVDNTDMIYYNPAGGHPKVGIGVDQPNATLHVRSEDPPSSGPSTAMFVDLIDSQLNLVDDRDYIGLRIYDHSTSQGTGNSRNIGLYVAEVSGQSSSERNLAAVLNGNVVVGDITGQRVGTGGTNVLAIQNGSAPTTAPPGPNGTGDGGVQLFVTPDATGMSVLNVMDGSGHVMQLHVQNPLSGADMSTVNPIYDGGTAAVIDNMRTRINELEARLQALGLLTP